MEISSLAFQNLPEYDHHKLVVKVEDESVGLKGFIAIHCFNGAFPALGATRLWNYHFEEEALRDALRLSKLMTYKSVLAGLPYTGAKAALILNPKSQINREAMFRSYAKKVNELKGQFVTGTDVGVSNKDLDIMCTESSFMIGEGVDSGYFTAIAVLDGIKRALKDRFGTDDVSRRTFAIQGLGKTGYPLLKFLVKAGAEKIYVTDINPRKAWYAKIRFPHIKLINPVEIHCQAVDVFCPCAMSHSINEDSVSQLQCKIVAGSANNQLDSKETGELLFKKGILYAPDFVINAGGIISVVDQYENKTHSEERILEKLKKVGENLSKIFETSRQENKAPNFVATEIADKIITNYAKANN
ncbi:MAG: Glu/Leu/Phe/Val dehydrogenase dimerization domain-containing protein [Candidatus Magasanikbacteria bacterium]